MKHQIFKALTAVILLATMAPAGAENNQMRVMSQNLYIGADLERLLAGEPPAAVLQTVLQTNFPARAVEIARAIDDFNPDLIGLQEVSLITLFDSSGNVLLELDYLAILLDALAARGENYAVGSAVDNADATLPIEPMAGTFGRLLDRDVILARTSTTKTKEATSANYTNNLTVDFGGFPLEFTRGYTAVNAKVKGNKTIRFVNTHLEVEDTPCVTPAGLQICQDLQSAELMAAIANEELAVVLVGDFNAELGTTAYQAVADAGYIDTWTIRYPYNDEPGYTCCQAEDLTGPNLLSTRIDHIFVRESDFRYISAVTTVVGDWEEWRTEDGLWYSDHGGPWARLTLTR